MKAKTLIILGLLLLGLTLVLAACSAPSATPAVEAPVVAEKVCPTAAPAAEAPACPEPVAPVVKDVPYQDAWASSGHNAVDAEAFNHWTASTPPEVPTSCAKCHTSQGFLDFAGADGSEVGKVDAAVPAPAGTIQCATCHNAAAQALTSVTFPSGKVVETSAPGEAICMTCHQGRESKVSVDKQIADFAVTDVDAVVAPVTKDGKEVKFGFRNVHYFAAGATFYGSQAQMGYEYDGKSYDVKFTHTEGIDTCTACHDQHATAVRVEKCGMCHEGVETVEDLQKIRMPQASTKDYNGNGDVTEGIAAEIAGLQATLLTSMQTYANEVTKTPITYDGATYPYFLVAGPDGQPAKDDKGAAIGYNAWSARLLKAAYNYQVSVKDPGAFAHNGKYIIELLYDSIEDMNAKLATPVDMATLTREDAGHFTGAAMAFRDWDSEGEVPYRCAKCHSATGLPEFIEGGGTVAYVNGSSTNVGIGPQHSSDGFMCSTCHDEAAGFPARYAVTSVLLPSGKTVSFAPKDADGKFTTPVDANICILCHQGRASYKDLDSAISAAGVTNPNEVSDKLTFKNAHYLAIAAIWFGSDAHIAYEYADQTYVGANTHIAVNDKAGCVGCHDVHDGRPLAEACKACHGVDNPDEIRFPTDTTDWDGDGNVTEGVRDEYRTMRDALEAQILTYAKDTAGMGIVYDRTSRPYFFADADGDGKADEKDGKKVAYANFTPALLKATYNYHLLRSNPGAGIHNPKYVLEIIYDSIKDLGGDVSKFTRP